MNSRRTATPTPQPGSRAVAVVVLALLMALLGLAVGQAHAAQLALQPGNLTNTSVSDRCTEAVAATHGTVTSGQATAVTLTGLGSACGGRDIDLTLYDESGEALVSTTTSLSADSSDSATVTLPAYTPADVAGVAMTIGTWGVPASWTATTPPVTSPLVTCTVLNDPTGTQTCEATDVRIESWGYPVADAYNFYATVTSSSASQDVEWQLTINLADSAFDVDTKLADSNNGVTLAPGWSCSSMPTLELRGRGDTGTQYVGGGSSVTIWMLGRSASGTTSGGSLFNCS